MHMYQVGEWIYYGNVGACQVVGIRKMKIPGMDREQLYYTLQPFEDSCSISTPADGGKIFMRPLLSKEEAEELIAAIPDIHVQAYYNPVLRQLSEHYEDMLNTHDCRNLIRMTMSIYHKQQEAQESKKKLGAVDERFMKKAEDLLYGELAVALGIEKKKVPAYIASALQVQEA